MAQRTLRLLSIAHGDGPGYELDTRLRPSGNKGLLVVSVSALAAYHDRSEPWERQALVKGRPICGDPALEARTRGLIEEIAYLRGPPPPRELVRLRDRMERELSVDRPPNRLDLKLGRGGLVDIEFLTQYLQMKAGRDPRVRSPETEGAIRGLALAGELTEGAKEELLSSYARLRLIERRLRLGIAASRGPVVERGQPGVLARLSRLGVPGADNEDMFFEELLALRERVRSEYSRILLGA